MLAEHRGDIRRYLQQQHPKADAPYGIEPECLETFVKSCAGTFTPRAYCLLLTARYRTGVEYIHTESLPLTNHCALPYRRWVHSHRELTPYYPLRTTRYRTGVEYIHTESLLLTTHCALRAIVQATSTASTNYYYYYYYHYIPL